MLIHNYCYHDGSVCGLAAPVRRTMDMMHVGGLKAAGSAGDGLITAAAQSAGLTHDGF